MNKSYVEIVGCIIVPTCKQILPPSEISYPSDEQKISALSNNKLGLELINVFNYLRIVTNPSDEARLLISAWLSQSSTL